MGIINDIPGYMISGVGNKDVNVPALRKHNFYDKLDSDFEFYSQLITLFRFQEQVQDFMRHHEFDKHVIVGFHVRTGNGEKGDFAKKKRGLKDIDGWVQNASSLLRTFSQNWTKPAKIFLATDTPGVADKLANATRSLPVIVVDQVRPTAGAGASNYHKWKKKEDCHNGWVAQFMDIVLLSLSDVVISGRYSSFTQSMPLVMMLGSKAATDTKKKKFINPSTSLQEHHKDEDPLLLKTNLRNPSKLFCEMGKSANGMHCYDDFMEWESHGKRSVYGAPDDDFNRQNHFIVPRVDVLEIFEAFFNGTALDVVKIRK
jgi:hypothetical protein